MSHKKAKKITITAEDPPESELEHRVDAMMSIEPPKPEKIEKVEKTEASIEAAPPETALAEVASAPELEKLDIPGIEDLTDADPATEPEVEPADTALPETATVVEEPTLAEAQEPIDDPDNDPTYDPMVDDIVAHEGDELLANADAAAAATAAAATPKKRPRSETLLSRWWRNKFARYATILIVLAGLGTVVGLPTTRYYTLNLAGVRAGASMTIVDSVTQLPLKNVTVELGTNKTKTNADGVVKLSKLQLGPQSLAISQTGFATINQTVTLGYGSNPLGDYKLEAVGMQFRVSVTNYVSGKPIQDAEINSEESNAKSDAKGQIILTVDHDESNMRSATISAEGYRDEKLTLKPGQSQNSSIKLVPAGSQVYVSKQSGRYDLYKVDVDGANKKLLLAGSGNEDANIAVAQSADGKEVALVSKRDTLKNQDGFVMQTLTLINADKGTTLTLEHSEQVKLVDWIGDRIIYVRIKAGSSAGTPDRYQLVSYNYTTNSRLQLASANNFNRIISAGGTLYYAASNDYQGGVSQFVRIRPDNSGKLVVLDKTDVWDVIRSSYNVLALVTDKQTYLYNLGDNAPKITEENPTAADNKFFLDNDDGKRALWFDSRDGKGTLLVNTIEANKDVVVTSQEGLTSPYRWLNDRTVVYRSTKSGETADYAVSLDGGTPKKIVDVTGTTGLTNWGY